MKILVGADPELFVRNPNNGEFVNAHGLVQGTKYHPQPVNFGAVQVDGMALEFNIDPADTAAQFVHNVTKVREQLQQMVPGYELVTAPVAAFSDSVFKEADPASLELGCEPDYDAWNDGKPNPRPDGSNTYRTASGHIHIGFTEGVDIRSINHTADCQAVVKQLDYYLGIYSLLWDPDNTRRSMYGKAGAYRPKPYGVEYRVMSNVWLSDERLMAWVFNAAVKAVEDLADGNKAYETHGDLARDIINNNEVNWTSVYRLGIPVPVPPGLKGLKVA